MSPSNETEDTEFVCPINTVFVYFPLCQFRSYNENRKCTKANQYLHGAKNNVSMTTCCFGRLWSIPYSLFGIPNIHLRCISSHNKQEQQ
jgi:hypothetical protein